MDETTRLRALLQDAAFLFVDVHAAMAKLRETAPEYWRVNGIGDQIATWQIHTAEVLGRDDEPRTTTGAMAPTGGPRFGQNGRGFGGKL